MKVRQISKTIDAIIISLSLLHLFPTATSANSIYNRSPWPTAYQGLDVEKENTDFQDAVHPCNRTHGRSFSVTHPDGFKLSGLSIYVYVPNNQTGKFDRNLFRLSFAGNNGISATYFGAIWMDGGGQTSEVYFPININVNGGVSYTAILECLTDEPDTFRVPESSRIGDGLTQYYDSTTSTANPYYMSDRRILFTTFSERNSPHFPALATINSQLSTVNSVPKFHPVIFVHGLGGDPSNFESDSENRNYVKLLTDLGYPRDYIHLYSYGYKYNYLKRVNEYNYQGDVREIAQGMEVAINILSDLNKSQGGDGKVDIVAHSLGNLVTRQYLMTHKDNHNVRRYIAVGAPFKGAWPLGVDNGISSLPFIGKPIEKAIADLFVKKLNEDRPSNRPLDKSSMAYAQVTPGSTYLSELNKTPITNIQFYAIYGNLEVTLNQKIFNRNFQRKIDVGDGLILAESATYSNWTANAKKFAYNDGTVMDLKFNNSQGVLAAGLVVTDMKSIRTLHGDLLTRKDSQGKITCLISNENADGC